VLLVDDHRDVLDRMVALLAGDFDVAGVSTAGRQALEADRALNPDVVVLDVDMPDLNGFETMHALKRAGSRASVVFLGKEHSEAVVTSAFRAGARGYVVKSHVSRDLPGALDQVHLGRLFVPSLTTVSHLAKDGGHAMEFHANVESFLDNLTPFLDLALRRGDATWVIGDQEIRTEVAHRLQAYGWRTGGATGHKRFRVLDTSDALDRLTPNGVLDAQVLADIATELEAYRLAVTDTPSARLTIVGDLAGTLCARGNTDAAMALEHHWDRLTHGMPFLTVCAYDASSFDGGPPELWASVCADHWAVCQTSDVYHPYGRHPTSNLLH
jgi:DNA-binding NarL/FixJ family response regulator